MSNKTRHIIFIVYAIFALIASVYHALSIYRPESDPPIVNPVASLRHAIFILINIIFVYGVLKRPKWFVWFVLTLTLQQWYSHGSYAIELWQQQHIVHWISVADILLLPLLLILLIADKKNKQQV